MTTNAIGTNDPATSEFLAILRHGPAALRLSLVQLAAVRREEALENREYKRRRLQIQADVASAVGEDKKPLFSNAEKREAEINRIIEASEEMALRQDRLDSLANRASELQIEVEYGQEQLRAARAAALLLAGGLGV